MRGEIRWLSSDLLRNLPGARLWCWEVGQLPTTFLRDSVSDREAGDCPPMRHGGEIHKM